MKYMNRYISALLFLLHPFFHVHLAANTPEDQQVAQELIDEARPYKGITQTDTHLTIEKVENRIKKTDDLKRNYELIHTILTRERELVPQGFVVFYSSVPNLRVYQDITRLMYGALNGEHGALARGAFQFIRYTLNDPAYYQYATVSDFLVQELSKEGVIDDNIAAIRTILVSTNIALWGNGGFGGESTWQYFNHPQVWASPNPEWLKSSLRSFGYPEHFASDLVALAQEFKTGRGELFQIFIPVTSVDAVAYSSWRQGIPFDTYFLQQLLHREIIGPFPNEDFHNAIFRYIAEYKAKYKAHDGETVKLTNYLIERVKMGAFYLSRLSTLYKKGTDPYMDYYQARLLVGPLLLDPTKGALIYRYSQLHPGREALYEQKLKGIFERMQNERVIGTAATSAKNSEI